MTDMFDFIFGTDITWDGEEEEFGEHINPCRGCPLDGTDCHGECWSSEDDEE